MLDEMEPIYLQEYADRTQRYVMKRDSYPGNRDEWGAEIRLDLAQRRFGANF